MDSGKQFLALVILKFWKYTVLVEAHNKLGHQGNSHTYCLIKRQYYWKGINKKIRKYIANCILCQREKAKVQHCTLQMTGIPDRPFNKITIDLVTECEMSTSGNKYILTIIDHLTGWPEVFPIPDKSADTIVPHLLMNIYQYTFAHGTSYQIMEWNSRIVSWTKSYNNLELTGYSQHHTMHRVITSLKSSTIPETHIKETL